jgi:hypothetical protein
MLKHDACGKGLAETVGSDPSEGMNVFFCLCMFVCVFTDKFLYDGPIPFPEISQAMCVIECDQAKE